MIQTNGPGGFGNANLFLMNPAGFLFGPNATVNVGGMVAFTTADYLRFQGNETLVQQSVNSSIAEPARDCPGGSLRIPRVQSRGDCHSGQHLTVAQGQSLSLVGGNKGFTATDPDNGNPIVVPDGITMTGGKLLAPGGQINIASVAGPGEISAVDFLPTPGMTMGNIIISQGALLDVSANAAGTVRIRGGQLLIDQATISADTANTDGAPIAIDINVTGSMSLANEVAPALTARTTGIGNAGAINIQSGNLEAITQVPRQLRSAD